MRQVALLGARSLPTSTIKRARQNALLRWIAPLACCLAQCAAPCDGVADSSRIASVGGSLTEILYLLRAEERIVAVDTTSNYPEQAQRFPSVGYVRTLSAEGLLSLRPTLVLGEHDMGPPEVLAAVRRAGVPVARVAETHSAAGIVAKVRCVASILELDAEPLIERRIAPVVAQLARLREQAPVAEQTVAFLLRLQDGASIGAGRGTSADGLLDMAVARNVFADFEGWKPVSAEALAHAAPDFIVATRRGVDLAGGVERLSAHHAVRATPAGRLPQRVIVVDGMETLGFGPRTLHAALRLAQRLRTEG